MYNLPMKLIIQIPCYNEENNILDVINSIPKSIKGVRINVVVIDDGSSDNTAKIASDNKVDVITMPHKGLSGAFMKGVEYAIEKKADILVNIDGDNQYDASQITELIEPIIEKRADIVVGCRPIDKINSFSPLKKKLQKFGSFVVKTISGIDIEDAASGFRAYNKEALLKLNVFNSFTYTIESIIQAANKGLAINCIKIRVNEQKNRISKLFKNDYDYILKQAFNLIRFFIVYAPAKFFSIIAIFILVLAIILGLRFLYFGSGHIQSLILCAILATISFISFALAILGDLISINRKMLEGLQYEQRLKKYQK